MKIDPYGQIVLSENDLCNLYMKDQDFKPKSCLIDKEITFNEDLELNDVPVLIKYNEVFDSIEEFDKKQQENWHMPEEYKNLDIAKWVLDQCTTDAERQRVGQELLLYLDRDLFPLLQYLKYIVDTMRKHNIIWGVGRGSSVSSYVLFLLGVHKIDSIFFDLSVSEFLR
jgi:DNA polymerase III alpha subunit